MMMKKKTINSIKEVIQDSMRVFIFPHILPDGDTIGSAFAMASYLHSLGKEVKIIVEDNIPSNLSMIPKRFNCQMSDINGLEMTPDLVIAVDSSDLLRLGKRTSYLNDQVKLVNIDHHKTNENFGHLNVIDAEASSTGEMVFQLLKTWEHELSIEEAIALYVAISTDTGSFKYSNTTARTMEIAGQIMSVGIDINSINTELYQNQPYRKIKLMTLALETLVMDRDLGYAHIAVTQSMLTEAGATYEDGDGLVEFVRNIEGVEVVAFFKEMNNQDIKVSLRAKHTFDVSAIALQFGGGGHAKAAGCLIKEPLEQAVTLINEAIKGGV